MNRSTRSPRPASVRLMAAFARRYTLSTSLTLTILTVLTIVFVRPVSSAQEDFTLTSPRLQGDKLTMKVDDEVEVAIAFTTTAEQGVEITQVRHPVSDEFIQITPTASGVTLKALKPAPSLNLTFTFKDKRKDIKVTINPKVTASNITVVQPANFPSLTTGTEQTPAPITQNKPYDLELGKIETKEAADLIKLVSADESSLRVSFERGHWVLTGLKPGSANVDVKDKVSNEQILSLKFNVQEAAQSIEPVGNANIRLKEPKPNASPEPKPLAEIFTVRGAAGGTFSLADALKANNPRIKIEPLEPAEFRIDTTNLQLFPKRAGTNQFTVTSLDTQFKQTFYVTVEPIASMITFKPALPVVITGETLSVIATVLDKEGKPQYNRQVKWESLDENRLAVVTDNNNVVQLIGLSAGATPVKVRATVVGDEATTQDLNVFVRGRDQVMGFAALLIRLDVIDEQMGRDLFGKKTVDDFYVAKVRLYNNLRNGNGENIGDSILVYSESLEANIALQKRCDGTNKNPECQQNRDQWVPLTSCDISVLRGLTQSVPFITASGQPAPPPPASPQCLLNTPYPLPEPTPTSSPAATSTTTASASPTPTPMPTPPPPTIDPNFPGRYRPYTFEMVANTHDRRDERSLRSRSLLLANSLGSIVSFVTSIAVPGPSSDLPLGLEKYQNLFIPSFEKLFPSLREAQRINLITQTMKPLEEVPYGSDITRIIFFPKKPLKGVLPGYVVRFTGISTYNLSAEVAIIKKTVTTR